MVTDDLLLIFCCHTHPGLSRDQFTVHPQRGRRKEPFLDGRLLGHLGWAAPELVHKV